MRFRRDGRHFAAAIKAWFCSLKKNRQIAILVGLAHIVAVLWMMADYYLTDRPKNRRPVVVRTIRPPAAPIHISSTSKHQMPKSMSPQPKDLAVSSAAAGNAQKATAIPSRFAKKATKSTTPVKAVSKKAVAKLRGSETGKACPNRAADNLPKRADEKAQPQDAPKGSVIGSTETLRQIQEELSAIADGPSIQKSASADIKLPGVLSSKAALLNASIEDNAAQTSIPSTYHLSLIEQLQSSLQLPELGDVRIKIGIEAPGTLFSIQILDAKSEKNAEWLKNQLPLLLLPCFNDFGIVDAILEFTITFRNVENS